MFILKKNDPEFKINFNLIFLFLEHWTFFLIFKIWYVFYISKFQNCKIGNKIICTEFSKLQVIKTLRISEDTHCVNIGPKRYKWHMQITYIGETNFSNNYDIFFICLMLKIKWWNINILKIKTFLVEVRVSKNVLILYIFFQIKLYIYLNKALLQARDKIQSKFN